MAKEIIFRSGDGREFVCSEDSAAFEIMSGDGSFTRIDQPAEPAGDAPAEPAGDEPAEPAGDAPTEPISGKQPRRKKGATN